MATLNKDNLNRLISTLEQSIALAKGIENEYHEDPVGFNMAVFFSRVGKDKNGFGTDLDDYVDNCGTVACLAGWCSILDGRSAAEASDSHVARFLGIDQYLALNIVYGSWVGKKALMNITAQEALDMLKDLLLTEGKPEWYRAYLLERISAYHHSSPFNSEFSEYYANTFGWDEQYAATF